MELDKHTEDQVKERMQELSKDKSFMQKLDQETAHLKGRNLKRYINREAVKNSEHEVRS